MYENKKKKQKINLSMNEAETLHLQEFCVFVLATKFVFLLRQ